MPSWRHKSTEIQLLLRKITARARVHTRLDKLAGCAVSAPRRRRRGSDAGWTPRLVVRASGLHWPRRVSRCCVSRRTPRGAWKRWTESCEVGRGRENHQPRVQPLQHASGLATAQLRSHVTVRAASCVKPPHARTVHTKLSKLASLISHLQVRGAVTFGPPVGRSTSTGQARKRTENER